MLSALGIEPEIHIYCVLSMKAVEVGELVKDYGGFRALRGISFEVKEGEVFGLIGPNGAGKTTALRVVATLLQITSGSVTVFGYGLQESHRHGVPEFHRQILWPGREIPRHDTERTRNSQFRRENKRQG